MYKSRKENGHPWFRRPYQPVSQWAGSEDTPVFGESTGTPGERNALLDILAVAKMLGKEVGNFFLLKVVFSLMLARVFVPLSVVLTNDLSGIEFWTGIVTILAAFVALTSVRLSCLTF